jgi:hypothetical protein
MSLTGIFFHTAKAARSIHVQALLSLLVLSPQQGLLSNKKESQAAGAASLLKAANCVWIITTCSLQESIDCN